MMKLDMVSNNNNVLRPSTLYAVDSSYTHGSALSCVLGEWLWRAA